MTPDQGIRVSTGSRLHFGLLDTVAPFGGVGVMIDDPATEIVLRHDQRFRCDDPAAARVRAIAQRVAEQSGHRELPACRIGIMRRPPAHQGLGSGTQLAMAVADAICQYSNLEIGPIALARTIAGRGERSAVGIHGYFHGGLIYESESVGSSEEVNPIRQRIELPDHWRVAVFQPAQTTSPVSGDTEREKFSKLAPADAAIRQELKSLIEQTMFPAAGQGDFQSFASAISKYNHRSGMLFAPVQGGPYNGQAVSKLIAALLDRGAQGVGQSSWGNSVFAWFESAAEASEFIGDLPADFAQCSVTKSRNQGREIASLPRA